ncbi:hypothetical protein WOLCODRAFT_110206 [Wolfiporia cocos MD-104 SS10]|uniref:Uncharacterized protein n=1 Tax=Wolfiporia cocos (strain MD-104) TaxID=742152 RepID=A0A2H3JB57_WOLCO|nr:hypothetical protein WOLCODRAFT_110206 [Wolfiporia cocos MD-104 SS10]
MAESTDVHLNIRSGFFTITNLAYLNRTRLPNKNGEEPIACWVPYGNEVIPGEQVWHMEFSNEGSHRCIIRNAHLNRHVATNPQAEPNDPVYGTAEKYWWHLLPDSSGSDVYRIKDAGTLSWYLPDGEDNTPACLEWTGLPRKHVLRFTRPMSVWFHGEVIADAIVDDVFQTEERMILASIRTKDTHAFQNFLGAILSGDIIQISVECHNFQYYPANPHYRLPGWDQVYDIPWRKDITFKGLRSFRHRVLLKRVRLTSGDIDSSGPYLHTNLIASIVNDSPIACTINCLLELYYGEHKNFVLYANSNNDYEINGCFQPLTPLTQEVKQFIESYFTSPQHLLVKIYVENSTADICGRLFNIPRFEINSHIPGLGRRIIHHVKVYLRFIPYITRRQVSFRFYCKNPFDAEVKFHSFLAEVFVRGVRVVHVKHIFPDNQAFILSAQASKWSPSIAHAFLVGRCIQILRVAADHAALLDVTIKSACIT